MERVQIRLTDNSGGSIGLTRDGNVTGGFCTTCQVPTKIEHGKWRREGNRIVVTVGGVQADDDCRADLDRAGSCPTKPWERTLTITKLTPNEVEFSDGTRGEVTEWTGAK